METIKSGKNMFMDSTAKILAKALDFRAVRQNVIAGNLANAETPGYVMKEIPFETELQKAVENTAIKPLNGESNLINSTTSAMDEGFDPHQLIREYGKPNELNIDSEMAKMSQNNLLYETATRLISKKFDALKTVIESRR